MFRVLQPSVSNFRAFLGIYLVVQWLRLQAFLVRELDPICRILRPSSQIKKYFLKIAAAAKSLQSCPTLYDPIDGSPPGSLVPGILQARTLKWVAIAFSNA